MMVRQGHGNCKNGGEFVNSECMHYDSERVRCIKIYGAIKKDLSDDVGCSVYTIPSMKIKIYVEMSSASFECLKKTNKLV